LFAQLVRTYSPRLLPHLRRYAATDADKQDLLQDVWLRAYRKRRTFAGRGSVFGWLLTVGRTVGLAAVDGRAREPVTEPLRDVPAAADGADTTVLRGTLRHAVLTLPERQREVLLLRLVEGMSTAETARLLQCAEGTVKATLHHAIRRLQELLKETVP
jgi:RNA polymerase sigma-70 factor (ECF subfamily)